MATVLDELVVKIVLNGQEFQAQINKADQGVKKFAEQTAQSATVAERGAQKMVDGFSRVTKEVLGVGAAILGVNGLKDLAVNLTQVAAATDRMAQAFEIEPETLNKWQNFLEKVGKQDFSTTASSLGTLSKAIQEFRATRKGPLLEAIPWLAKLHISPEDMLAGTPSQALNAMLLKAGANINNPENVGIRTEILSHVPGMTPGMMNALDKAPTQAMLDKYLTATREQMAAAERIRETFVDAAQTIKRILNEHAFSQQGESAATLGPDIITGKQPLLHPKSNLDRNPLTILMQELGLFPGTLTGGGDVHGPTSAIGRRRAAERNAVAPQTFFPNPGPLGGLVIPRDTSTMLHTNRSSDGHRRGGTVTNNITAYLNGIQSNAPPQEWADAFEKAVRSKYHLDPTPATGGSI